MQLHAARDGFVFLPRDEDFDKPVTFGMLAGAAVLYRGDAASTAAIDYYQIWAWADVNGNGEADPGDLLEGGLEQNWINLLHKSGAPGNGNDAAGTAPISNLIKHIPDEDEEDLHLQTGIQYLLLLRVHVTRSPGDSGSSLQFNGGIERDGETVRLAQTPNLQREGWSSTAPPNPQYPELGHKYISKSGNDKGVDDFEVLWIRVNNPPRGPRH